MSDIYVRQYISAPFDDEARVPLDFALGVARDLRDCLAAACERTEIAGSIRRGKPTVKDIELLCIPKVEGLYNLFGEPINERNHLHVLLDELLWCDYRQGDIVCSGGLLEKRPNKNGDFTWGDKNRYAIHRPTGIAVDIFIVDERNWGLSLVIRTGSADFNKAMMSRFQKLGMKGTVHEGVVGKNGETIECPDEKTVFKLLGWEFMEPQDRETGPRTRKRVKPKQSPHCLGDGCQHRSGLDPHFDPLEAKKRADAMGERNYKEAVKRRAQGLSLLDGEVA